MNNDLNFWRSAITLLSLLLFLTLLARTWSRRRRAGFDEAALLPFLDEAVEPGAAAGEASASASQAAAATVAAASTPAGAQA